ncbi:hypothetical protein BAY61_03735 [Prauserella marina]|uniref:Uncharacterized protein n=1 Tax=Prauserella marina TaxID=530584 RepID=A0A222VK00_9PSEU|nr:hypothetical protein [Prauserella marina]ASR34248.1 hypothetical protein BAY61_03735 [Prauserella marina]PWV71986.1 hypothetical protein DES30_111157 [Prauserella marina]SDD92560.1 hypothetical protein SAMN05421630_114156 [Prauserella marina]
MVATVPRRSRLNAVLVAPGASPAELRLSYGAAVSGLAFAAALALANGLNVLQAGVLLVLGFDLVGGVVVNATTAASRRFHGAGSSRWRPILFVAAHGHLLVVAALFPGLSWPTAAALYLGTLASAVLVVLVPPHLRAPVAFAGAAALLILATALLSVPAELAWISPLLTVKLLLAHLLRHGQG